MKKQATDIATLKKMLTSDQLKNFEKNAEKEKLEQEEAELKSKLAEVAEKKAKLA